MLKYKVTQFYFDLIKIKSGGGFKRLQSRRKFIPTIKISAGITRVYIYIKKYSEIRDNTARTRFGLKALDERVKKISISGEIEFIKRTQTRQIPSSIG